MCLLCTFEPSQPPFAMAWAARWRLGEVEEMVPWRRYGNSEQQRWSSSSGEGDEEEDEDGRGAHAFCCPSPLLLIGGSGEAEATWGRCGIYCAHSLHGPVNPAP